MGHRGASELPNDKQPLTEARLYGAKNALLYTAVVPLVLAIGFMILIVYFYLPPAVTSRFTWMRIIRRWKSIDTLLWPGDARRAIPWPCRAGRSDSEIPVMDSHAIPGTGTRTFTFLGTGTSVGVPMIGCDCAVCRSTNPRNHRYRCSVLIQAPRGNILIDTPPELRLQLLRARREARPRGPVHALPRRSPVRPRRPAALPHAC